MIRENRSHATARINPTIRAGLRTATTADPQTPTRSSESGDDCPVTAWVSHDKTMVDARGINIEPLSDEMTGCLNHHNPLNWRQPCAAYGPESDREVLPRFDQVAHVLNEKFHVIHEPASPPIKLRPEGSSQKMQGRERCPPLLTRQAEPKPDLIRGRGSGIANVHEGSVPKCQRQRPQRKAQRQALIDSVHAVAAAAALPPSHCRQ